MRIRKLSVGIKLKSYITEKMSTVMYSDLNAHAVTLAKIVNEKRFDQYNYW